MGRHRPEIRDRLWNEMAKSSLGGVVKAAQELSRKAGIPMWEATAMLRVACVVALERLVEGSR